VAAFLRNQWPESPEYAVLLYMIEVKLGSSIGVHNPEFGFDPQFCNSYKLSRAQFYILFLPFFLVALCLRFIL
jgi:hypothetical protein